MNQFDKHQIIPFYLGNETSIKEALVKYKELLDSNKAVVNQVFDVEFKIIENDTQRRIQVADTNNQKLVKNALNMGPDGGPSYYPNHIGDTDEIYISEVLFFAIALEYPSLKEAVVTTAKAIVAHSRRFNDTWNLWIDDMRVFGIEALYMLARTDANYTYLLSQFLIPYWDDEHAVGYEEYLRDLFQKNGWNRPMIKAFIWCDNSYFRQAIVTSQEKSLGNYLKANPEEYTYFKRALQERFVEEPVLLPYGDDDPEETHPVLDIYFSLVVVAEEWAESIEDNEEVLQEHFIEDTLENEAFDLEKKIKNTLQKPLSKINEEAQREKDEDEEREAYFDNYEYGDGLKSVKELILHLHRGADLWKYVQTGQHKEALNDLPQTDLLPLAKEHARVMYLRMLYFTGGYRDENEVRESLENIISDVTAELLSLEEDDVEKIYQNGLILTIKTRPTGTPEDTEVAQRQQERNAMYLRILDVFYYAFGKKPFDDDIKDVVTKNDPLLSVEEYQQRYHPQLSKGATPEEKEKHEKNIIIEVLREFADLDTKLSKKNFDDAAFVFEEKRERRDCSWWPKDNLGCCALATHLLFQDFQQRVGDDYTQRLFNYVNENVWTLIAKMVEESLVNPIDEKNKDLDPIKEQALGYITEANTTLTEEEALEAFSRILLVEEGKEASTKQKKYDLFDNAYEDNQRTALICYWLSQMPLPSQHQAKRLWKLWVALAPQKVIQLLAKITADDEYDYSFENPLKEIDFYDRIEKNGVPKSQSIAFQMVVAQKMFHNSWEGDKAPYLVWLDKYNEIDSTATGMFDVIDKKRALALDEGMHYIDAYRRIEYFIDLSLQNERFPFNQPEAFKETVSKLFQENLVPWYKRLATYNASVCKSYYNYYNDENKETSALEKLPISFHPNAVTNLSTKINDYNQVQLLQKKGEELVILQLDKAYNDHRLEDSQITSKKVSLPYGQFVLFPEEIDTEAILNAIRNQTTDAEDVEMLVTKLQEYLDDEVSYADMASLCNKMLKKEDFNAYDRNYSAMTIQQFIWMLSEEKQHRFIKLFANHSLEGTKMLTRDFTKAFLRMKVREKEVSLEEIREKSEEEEYKEAAFTYLLNLLDSLEVNPLYIADIALDEYNEASKHWFIALGAEKLFDLSQNFSVDKRVELIEMLSESEEATNVLKPFLEDVSRMVRDAAESVLNTSETM